MCVYTMVLFTVFLIICRKQCKCLDVVNEGKNLWDICKMEYHSTMKRNSLFTEACRNKMDSNAYW